MFNKIGVIFCYTCIVPQTSKRIQRCGGTHAGCDRSSVTERYGGSSEASPAAARADASTSAVFHETNPLDCLRSPRVGLHFPRARVSPRKRSYKNVQRRRSASVLLSDVKALSKVIPSAPFILRLRNVFRSQPKARSGTSRGTATRSPGLSPKRQPEVATDSFSAELAAQQEWKRTVVEGSAAP